MTTIEPIVRRLNRLHTSLEERGEKDGNDWALARNLEDTIGNGQASAEVIQKAEALLERYNF